jgi:hypothetical protein
LANFSLKNVARKDLTHVTIEVIAENQWGEKAAHYYFVPQIDAGERVALSPTPRWDKRRLDFANTLDVAWSVWSDQGCLTDRREHLTSPKPNPDPAAWRADYLGFDQRLAGKGEALGAVVQQMSLIPVDAASAKKILLDAVCAGHTYAFRINAPNTKPVNLVIRFVRDDADGMGADAEVIDLATKKPYRPDIPVWKAAYASTGGPYAAYELGNGWAFTIGQDERPKLITADGDVSLLQVELH